MPKWSSLVTRFLLPMTAFICATAVLFFALSSYFFNDSFSGLSFRNMRETMRDARQLLSRYQAGEISREDLRAAVNPALSTDGGFFMLLDSDKQVLAYTEAAAPYFAGDTLHSLLESAGADAAASGMTLVYPGGSDERAVRPDAGIFRGKEEILRAFLIDGRGIYGACGKLFRRAAVGDVRFSAYTRAEDALFCVRVLSRCGVYAVTDAAGYLYYRRQDSVTMRGRDERSIDQVRAWTEIYGIIEKTAPELCRFAAEKICHDIDALFPLGGAAGRELKALRETYYPLKFPGGRLPAGKIPAAILYRISPRAYYSLIRDRWARERRES